MLLHILPGVLSPRLSHAPDALISKWHIESGATVLDLGCGSGVLGLAALRAGAEHLVALDINPQAVLTTKLNIERLGHSKQAEARLFHPWIPPSAAGQDQSCSDHKFDNEDCRPRLMRCRATSSDAGQSQVARLVGADGASAAVYRASRG
nr:50S ribosomal protein L11 methyltransferase [Bradyrhizobium sp. CCBAU 53421]